MKNSLLTPCLFVASLVVSFSAIACGAHVHDSPKHLHQYTEQLVTMGVCSTNQHISEAESEHWFEVLSWATYSNEQQLFEHYVHFAAEHVGEITQQADLAARWSKQYCEAQFAEVDEMKRVELSSFYTFEEIQTLMMSRQYLSL